MLRWSPSPTRKGRSNGKVPLTARVAIKALSGAYTLAELAKKHDVHPNMISQWKRTAQQNLPALFAKKADRAEAV